MYWIPLFGFSPSSTGCLPLEGALNSQPLVVRISTGTVGDSVLVISSSSSSGTAFTD